MCAAPPPDPDFCLRSTDSPVTSVCFWNRTPGETSTSHVVSGTEMGAVDVWDLSLRRRVYHLQAHQGAVLWLKHLEADGRILSQGRDGRTVLWQCEPDAWTLIGKYHH